MRLKWGVGSSGKGKKRFFKKRKKERIGAGERREAMGREGTTVGEMRAGGREGDVTGVSNCLIVGSRARNSTNYSTNAFVICFI